MIDNLTGTWHSDLGSTLNIKHSTDGEKHHTLVGTYRSQAGHESELNGEINLGDGDSTPKIEFTVLLPGNNGHGFFGQIFTGQLENIHGIEGKAIVASSITCSSGFGAPFPKEEIFRKIRPTSD